MKLRENNPSKGANYRMQYGDGSWSYWIDFCCHGHLQDALADDEIVTTIREDVRLAEGEPKEFYREWLHHLLNKFTLSYLTDTKDVDDALKGGVYVDLTRGSLRHVKAFLMYLRAGKEIFAHRGYKRLLEGGVEDKLAFVLSRVVNEKVVLQEGIENFWGQIRSDHSPINPILPVKAIHEWALSEQRDEGSLKAEDLVGAYWETLQEASSCHEGLIEDSEGASLDSCFESEDEGGFGRRKAPTIDEIIKRIVKEQLCVES